jgi:co-chaperonin GroES (HSP10)
METVMIPKSVKLTKDEAKMHSVKQAVKPALATTKQKDATFKHIIRKIDCLNEFVAIMQFEMEMKSGIELPDSKKFINEGIVVGVGPGVSDSGARGPSQLKIGDVVMFSDRNIVTTIASEQHPYAEKKLILISERSLMCKLPAVPFDMVD